MSARWRLSLPLLLLAAAVVLAAAAPVWAHPASDIVPGESPLPTLIPDPLTSSPPAPTAAPQPPALPWPLLVGALVAAVAVRCHRRVVAALALVLLLSVFAFENALHSVHHGLDQGKAEGCAIAAASAQLAATTVDAATEADLLSPPAEDRVLESALTVSVVRFPCPDQGRAPPA